VDGYPFVKRVQLNETQSLSSQTWICNYALRNDLKVNYTKAGMSPAAGGSNSHCAIP